MNNTIWWDERKLNEIVKKRQYPAYMKDIEWGVPKTDTIALRPGETLPYSAGVYGVPLKDKSVEPKIGDHIFCYRPEKDSDLINYYVGHIARVISFENERIQSVPRIDGTKAFLTESFNLGITSETYRIIHPEFCELMGWSSTPKEIETITPMFRLFGKT